MRVVRVFNNNVLLAHDGAGAEVVLMGRGLGFQARPGDAVREDDVERTFVAGGSATPEHIAALLEDIPPSDLDLAQRIVDEARTELGPHITAHVLMPLADHLSYALRRARAGTEIAYPLQWEVLHLYPREVAFARRCLAEVASSTGVRLPDLEAVPLALHFVNAQLGGGDGGEMARTFEMTEAFAAALGIVRALHGCVLDEESLEVARFVTHLRYLFVRQARGEAGSGGGSAAALREAVRGEHPRALDSAVAIAGLLRGRFGWDVGGEEEVYLALHVARLASGAG